MKKIIIHSFEVNTLRQKVAFQIKLPLNAKQVKGIHVTSTGYMILANENEVGWLWLRSPQIRDVFFAHILKTTDHAYSNNSFVPEFVPFGSGDAWIDGKKESFLHLDLDVKNPLLEGYYTNELRSRGLSYNVNIYITLEV